MGILFWGFDSFIDAVILGEGTFVSQLLTPEPVEIWIRVFVLFLFVSFSLLMRREFRKRRALYEKLQENQTAIKKKARENELLLKEIHHRVKNNMQVMSSICHLQSKHIEDEQALGVLQNSSSRIQAMAFVHEHLYSYHTLSEIKENEYFNALVQSTLRVFQVKPEELNFTSSIANTGMDPDTLITLGLILNELMSNSLKHAFGNIQDPGISLRIFRNESGKHKFIYQDNGAGIPEGHSGHDADNMGIFLINSFVQRLDGTIEIDGSSGTTVQITF